MSTMRSPYLRCQCASCVYTRSVEPQRDATFTRRQGFPFRAAIDSFEPSKLVTSSDDV